MLYSGNLLRNQKPRPRLQLVPPPEPVEDHARQSRQASALVVAIVIAVFALAGMVAAMVRGWR